MRVVRRPDDPDDTRRKRPQAKTLSRILPLSPKAHRALRAYLMLAFTNQQLKDEVTEVR